MEHKLVYHVVSCYTRPKNQMMMMMNCFCGIVDRRKVFSLISSRDHCQRFSPSWISDTTRAGFAPAQNLSSGFYEWSCAVVITTTSRPHRGRDWNNPAFILIYFVNLTLIDSIRNHQEVRNVSFSENFAYVLNELSLSGLVFWTTQKALTRLQWMLFASHVSIC